MQAAAEFVPFREKLSSTVLRTFLIALIPAMVRFVRTNDPRVIPAVFLGALWISFGGHWVEMLWLDQLRHRIPSHRWVQVIGRLAYWFLAGALLSFPVSLTAEFIYPGVQMRVPPVVGGVSFIVIELIVHALLLARTGRPSFYDGRG